MVDYCTLCGAAAPVDGMILQSPNATGAFEAPPGFTIWWIWKAIKIWYRTCWVVLILSVG
jgi:hypothetical protein